jgi:hypothetical protein
MATENPAGIEVEIVDDGSYLPGEEPPEPEVEIEVEIGEEDEDDEEPEAEESGFNENLADEIDESILTSIATDLISDFDDDVSSRKDWIQTYTDGLELLGLKIEKRTEPWAGACGAFHPLLSEALVKFQSETIMETFPASGPVKTKMIGKETPEKKKAAERVEADMNYQLTEVMTEYRAEHERMLWGLGLSGNAFKKVYYDPSIARQVSIYLSADDVVVPYGASNLETAERVTHVMRKSKNEVKRLQAAGFYRDIDLGDPNSKNSPIDESEKKIAENMGFSAVNDNRYRLLEMCVYLDLAEYGYNDPELKNSKKEQENPEVTLAAPYIITLDYSTEEVLAIRRNWEEDDEKHLPRQHFVHYGYIPGFGFYHFGLIHLLGSFAKSGTSLIRQLVDAGTLSNLPGGYKTKGLRIKGDDTPISPGEWRDVDVASGSLKENIMPLPYKEPSQVLFALMQNIVEEGRRFASIADLKLSDMSAQAPVGTTLAILERTLKVMSAVQARIHASMKQEFKLLAKIIRDYTPKAYSYEPEDGEPRAKKADYDMVEVIPVSDPNASTMAQRVVQYQAVMQMAQATPQIYDLPQLHRQMLEVMGVKNPGKIIPTEEDQTPKDPVSENMAIMNGKPVKAFLYQDHEAHITVHMAAMQDPLLAQMMGQNPMAQQIQSAAMAHISEHLAFAYRKKIEEQLGVPLPPPDEKLPENVEVALSQLTAQAAQKLLQANTAQAQQQQAQQEAQDPLNIIQQKELALKEQELAQKGQKDAADIEIRKADLILKAAKVEADTNAKDKELEVRQLLEGVKLGMQAIPKDKPEPGAQPKPAEIEGSE